MMETIVKGVQFMTEEQRLETMASRIKQLRTKKGITQLEMAKRLEKSQSAYASWEAGDRFPPTDIMPLLVEKLDTTYDYLYGRSDDPKPRSESELILKAEEKTLLKLLGVNESEAEILGRDRINTLLNFYRFQLKEAAEERKINTTSDINNNLNKKEDER